jgi:arylsulfatase A-like enzyme
MSAPTNVLLVVLGGVRADRLSCYGYDLATTPCLDAIAHDGIRFPNMISTAPWTLSAHASLFTGQFCATHGATHEHHFLSPTAPLLPEYLRNRGYRTAAFSASDWISPETGFGRGFDAFFTQKYNNRLASRAVTYGRSAGDRILRRKDSGARRTNQALLEWLDGGDAPFFAYVHYQEARLPVDPPSPFDDMFQRTPAPTGRVSAISQDGDRHFAGQPRLDDAALEQLKVLYDGAVRYVDSRLEEVATFLQQKGRWDDTLVVITGDHGESLGEHGVLGHRFTLSDSLLRIPLVMRCPRIVPQGFVLEEVAQSTDVLPTILDLLEMEPEPGAVQGRALVREGRATPGPGYAIAERFRTNLDGFRKRFPEVDCRGLDVRQKTIRTVREKFVWHSDEANELYDLAGDPGERRNLVDSETHRADALRRKLFDWFASVPQREPEGLSAEASGQHRLSYAD